MLLATAGSSRLKSADATDWRRFIGVELDGGVLSVTAGGTHVKSWYSSSWKEGKTDETTRFRG